MCMCVQHVWLVPMVVRVKSPETGVVSQCASVGNWNWVLWRNIKCSGPLGYVSSPQNFIFNVLIEKINDRKEKTAS